MMECVPQQDLLWLLIHARFLQILQAGLRVVLPQLLQLVDLLRGDLTGPQLVLVCRHLHQPGQELAVLDQGLPLGRVPENRIRLINKPGSGKTGLNACHSVVPNESIQAF